MKNRVLTTLLLVMLFLFTRASAEITPFMYIFSTPSPSDLSQQAAEMIADNYFHEKGSQIEDIQQYVKTTHFIRMETSDGFHYCWVVAYNDGTRMSSNYGFVGMVIISSPDGRIIDFSTGNYFEAFSRWEPALKEKYNSTAVIWGIVDLIALPEDNRIKHILPDMYTIQEEEATSIGHQRVAGYQNIATTDIQYKYNTTITLTQNLLVSKYPIWKIQYISYKAETQEVREMDKLHYTVAIYAHNGEVWYVIDQVSQTVLYADHSYCNLPLSEENFESTEWMLEDWHLLWQNP